MTIYKKTQEEISRYTFVTNVKYSNGYVYITYLHNNEEKTRKISYRASYKQLEDLINKIKDEIGFEETKKQRDILVKKELKKPMMFVNDD